MSEGGSRQEGTTRSSHMSGRQVSGRQISGKQISGGQASERQNRPSNKLLPSGRQASQEGPGRQRTTAAQRGESSQQRGLAGQGGSGRPSQGGRAPGSQRSSRQQVLRRAVSSPKLDLIPERSNNTKRGERGGGGNTSQVPRLQLDFSGSSASTVVPHGSRRKADERSRLVFSIKSCFFPGSKLAGSDFHTKL